MALHPNILSDPLSVFPDHPPQKVVSLVPSYTASLFDLGLGDSLVGITDYCVYPSEGVEKLPRVGGPKNPRLEQIQQLQPDLVLANREENTRDAVEALAGAGVPVWVTFPTTVRSALKDLWAMASLFRSELAMERTRSIERSLEWAEMTATGQPPVRYFCPIWEDRLETGERWWMTFNEQSYSSDVLSLFGGVNIFAGRQRRYPLLAELGHAVAEEPGERDTRYPRVSLAEIVNAQPEVILLPDEPFLYTDRHADEMTQLFAQTPAGQQGRVHRIDGTWIHWPGTRVAIALTEMPALF